MAQLIYSFLCVSLLAVVLEDFRYRAIHWPWFLMLAIAAVLVQQYVYPIKVEYTWWVINLAFLIMQGSVLFLYLSLKNGQVVNPFRNHIGTGDLLFVLAIIPLFPPFHFILFICISMSVTLLLHYLSGFLFSNYNRERIPLAGWMGLKMLLLLFISYLVNFNWFDDSYILTVITQQ